MTRLLIPLLVLLLTASSPAATPKPQVSKEQNRLNGLKAMRTLMGQRDWKRAEAYGYQLIWDDMRDYESLNMLAQAIENQNRKDEAGLWNTLLLRALENAPPADIAKYKAPAEAKLKLLNVDWEKRKAEYAKNAAGRRFESPEKVDDEWMTHVRADLNHLHSLYAWKILGGRTDVKPDWIHNRFGAMHRSGMKLVEEVDGRNGVLFTRPRHTEGPNVKQPVENTIRMPNVGNAKVLRIGAKGYNWPSQLIVKLGDRQIASEMLAKNKWSDLKIDLPDPDGKPQEIILELVIPKDQKWAEGVWVDYVDFFEN